MDSDYYNAPATTCAYLVALSALRAEAKVAEINYSEQLYVINETSDKKLIAREITRQEKRGTRLPEKELEEIVRSDGRKDLIIVSDGVIYNYDRAQVHFEKVLNLNLGNKGYFILIGKENKRNYFFKEIGFEIIYHH